MSTQGPYKAFLYWLLLAGVFSFFIFLSWDLGFLNTLFEQDITRISLFIFLLFVLSSIYCCYRSWFLSCQSAVLAQFKTAPYDEGGACSASKFSGGASPVRAYISGVSLGKSESDKVILAELLSETLKGSHQVGWFVAALVIKLGLLGTVVGFVLMLSSISGIGELDISDIKDLMQQMTQGMGVAMNTTMIGLISSMLLGVQLLLLDRCADGLIVDVVDFTQSVEHGSEGADDNASVST